MNRFFDFIANPFEHSTDLTLLRIGSFFFAVQCFFAFQWDFLADGILHVSYTGAKDWWQVLLNNAINTIALIAVLYLIAKLVYQKTRLMDIIITALLAQSALSIVNVLLMNPALKKFVEPISLAIETGDLTLKTVPVSSLVYITIQSIIALFGIYYFFHLTVIGTKLAMNSKKGYHTILIILLVLVVHMALYLIRPYF